MHSHGVRRDESHEDDKTLFHLFGCIPVRILRPDEDSGFLFLWEWIIGIISLWYLVNVPLEFGFEYDMRLGNAMGSSSRALRTFFCFRGE